MARRHTPARFASVLVGALALAACGQAHSSEGDAGTSAPADGSTGVCCPIDPSFSGCSPGIPGRPGGGWAPTAAGCDAHVVSGYDGRPFARVTDEHGCEALIEIEGCCGCVPPPIDAGSPPSECDGLAPADCLAAFCVPMFDDACCPACGGPEPVCADCFHPSYLGCVPDGASSCRGGPGCGMAPIWACGPAAPDCASAHPLAIDACSVTGCVPAYPSGMGEPSLESATCVAITATSCSAFCRRLPPPCPTGTVPEGDGSCYTDRCIPAFVCASPDAP